VASKEEAVFVRSGVDSGDVFVRVLLRELPATAPSSPIPARFEANRTDEEQAVSVIPAQKQRSSVLVPFLQQYFCCIGGKTGIGLRKKRVVIVLQRKMIDRICVSAEL